MAIGENGTPEKPARKKPKHQEDKRAFLPPLNLENLKWDSEHRAEIGSGIQTETESDERTGGFSFDVLTEREASLASAICRLLQETLPIPRFVFPGDPARRRYTLAELQYMRSVAERITGDAAAVAKRLTRVIEKNGGPRSMG